MLPQGCYQMVVITVGSFIDDGFDFLLCPAFPSGLSLPFAQQAKGVPFRAVQAQSAFDLLVDLHLGCSLVVSLRWLNAAPRPWCHLAACLRVAWMPALWQASRKMILFLANSLRVCPLVAIGSVS